MSGADVLRRHLPWLAVVAMVTGCTTSPTAASPNPSTAAVSAAPTAAVSRPAQTPSSGTSAPTRSMQQGPDGPHLPADVTYLMQLTDHHRRSIALADVAIAHTSNERIKIVAAYIRQEQLSELSPTTSWLKVWTSAASTTGTASASTALPSAAASSPAVTDQDLKQLSASTGQPFDELFLRLMIRSHRSSLALSQWEQQQGASPAVLTMAQVNIAAATAEIQQLLDLRQ